jgi:hypothetical protein
MIPPSETAYIEDGLCEGAGRFLRQVVSNPAGNGSMVVFAGEPGAVGRGLRVRSAVGVAFHRYCRNRDRRSGGKSPFDVIISRFALGQAKTPAVVVNDNFHVIGIFELGSCPIEGRVVELPLR